MPFDLAFIWAGLIALSVLIYVILDGFDLGIGILFPFAKSEKDRDMMMNSVAPVWDGNETWLVMGGGGLFAVFPLAYAIVMPALYMPISLMLLALIFRGVSFEYRWRVKNKAPWNFAFFAGSLIASFTQGIALGSLVQGIEISGRSYAGGWFNWLTPFSLWTGVAVVIGYALLGSTWLVAKLEGNVQIQMRQYSWYLGAALLVMIGVASIWTPLLNPEYFDRWFNLPASIWTMIVPMLMLLLTWSFFTSLNDMRDVQPFVSALGFFCCELYRPWHQFLSYDGTTLFNNLGSGSTR